jgi:diacylglycerol kinase
MRFLRSFKFAFRGISFALRGNNFKIQMACAVLVIIAGWRFQISWNEWLAIVICIGAVLSAEAFNTAIEKFADFIHPQQNEKIGQVKDIAAGAVLILAIISLIVALIIFIPKFF